MKFRLKAQEADKLIEDAGRDNHMCRCDSLDGVEFAQGGER